MGDNRGTIGKESFSSQGELLMCYEVRGYIGSYRCLMGGQRIILCCRCVVEYRQSIRGYMLGAGWVANVLF